MKNDINLRVCGSFKSAKKDCVHKSQIRKLKKIKSANLSKNPQIFAFAICGTYLRTAHLCSLRSGSAFLTLLKQPQPSSRFKHTIKIQFFKNSLGTWYRFDDTFLNTNEYFWPKMFPAVTSLQWWASLVLKHGSDTFSDPKLSKIIVSMSLLISAYADLMVRSN